MRYLSGITRTYLRLLRAKNYYLSDPSGVREDDLDNAVILQKRAEKIYPFIPKSKEREKQRKRPSAKRIKIRKAIKKSYFNRDNPNSRLR